MPTIVLPHLLLMGTCAHVVVYMCVYTLAIDCVLACVRALSVWLSPCVPVHFYALTNTRAHTQADGSGDEGRRISTTTILVHSDGSN